MLLLLLLLLMMKCWMTMRKCSEEERKRSTLSCQFLGFYTHPKHFFLCVCAPKRFLRRGTSTRVPHILERKARTRNARSVQRRERRETEESRCSRCSEKEKKFKLFFDRKKKKKWNKIVSAIGILAVGGKRISRIISRLVAFTASFETEKAERERTKNRY